MSDNGFLKDSYVERNAEETRDHYDAWSTTYDAELQANDYSTPANSLAALERLAIDRNSLVLDVGCGTGLFGRELASAGYTTIDGCDYSPGMLEQARQTGLYRSLFQVNLNEPPLAADGKRVASNAYDAAAVVGVFSFGHVEAAAMDEIVRVVRPQGAIVIGLNDTFWNEGSLQSKLHAMQDAGTIAVIDVRAGDHLPGTDLSGWFVSVVVA